MARDQNAGEQRGDKFHVGRKGHHAWGDNVVKAEQKPPQGWVGL